MNCVVLSFYVWFVVICVFIYVVTEKKKETSFRFPQILYPSGPGGKECEAAREKGANPLCFRQLGWMSFSHFWGKRSSSRFSFPSSVLPKMGYRQQGRGRPPCLPGEVNLFMRCLFIMGLILFLFARRPLLNVLVL